MTTFFYFQSLMWHTNVIDYMDDEFYVALKESNEKKYTNTYTWIDAQYQWYGLDRMK